MLLDGKIVLITGASSGIGAGTAIHFASHKASLVLTGRNEGNLLKVAEDCKKAGSPNVFPVVGDLTKEDYIQKIIDETIKNFGKLDVLVNNAGISEYGGIESTSLDQLDRIFATNVRAVYELTRLAVPFLLKTKGNIVNVSSVAGTRSFPGFLSYCMSKSALDQFTKCVALELAPKGVRVNSVNPAVVDTDIFRRAGMDEHSYKTFLENCKQTHPLGRHGNVQDVALAIAFLATDDSSFITGVQLHVSGGRHLVSPME